MTTPSAAIAIEPTPVWLKSCLWLALVLAVLTVVNSAYIRLVESGVGCEPWPTCYGQYIYNENSQGINVLTPKIKQADLAVARVSHRLVATTLGFVILAIFIASRRKQRHLLNRTLVNAASLVTLILASIGSIHPTQPQPLLVLANFSGGLLLVAFCAALVNDLKSQKPFANEPKPKSQLALFVRLGLLIVGLQLFWGGWTSANYSGAACSGLLKCQAEAAVDNPQTEASGVLGPLQLVGSQVTMEAKMSVYQWVHHGLAVICLPYFLALVLMSRRSDQYFERKLSGNCLWLLSLVIGQFLVGLIALEFGLPALVMLGHSLLAALLVIAMTFLHGRLSTLTTKESGFNTLKIKEKF